ncbi:MAG: hypothetical protein OXC14_04140, partial [Rhodospirillaceae bacterium]|nr:hypothetical protein [Rhodospirillaceae bacterium]
AQDLDLALELFAALQLLLPNRGRRRGPDRLAEGCDAGLRRRPGRRRDAGANRRVYRKTIRIIPETHM